MEARCCNEDESDLESMEVAKSSLVRLRCAPRPKFSAPLASVELSDQCFEVQLESGLLGSRFPSIRLQNIEQVNGKSHASLHLQS